MTILFILRSSANLFYTQSVFEDLLKRGHDLKALYDRDGGKENEARFKSLQTQYPNFDYGRALWRSDKWKAPLYYARALLSYRKYLFMKDQSLYYRDRYKKFMHGSLKFLVEAPVIGYLSNWAIKSSVADKLLRLADKAAGLDRQILTQVESAKPDVIVICVGGLRYGSFDIDYLKVAERLRIPSVAFVMTWDSLSSKSLIQIVPDVLLVLNEFQAEEAYEQHQIPKSRIRITGAAVFDRWFGGLKMSSGREEFCRNHGLDARRPILLYLGSPMSNTQDETWALEDMRKALDESGDERLRNMQIIMRPHPDNAKFYDKLSASAPRAVVIPKGGQWPGTEESLRLFYDTLFHSIAAVGVNTSAMIETMLAGKPVIAVILDKYKKTQAEAMHFKKMLLEGAMAAVNNFQELAEELKNILDKKDLRAENRKMFIKKFIRPYGLGISAASKICGEIETLVKSKTHETKTS